MLTMDRPRNSRVDGGNGDLTHEAGVLPARFSARKIGRFEAWPVFLLWEPNGMIAFTVEKRPRTRWITL